MSLFSFCMLVMVECPLFLAKVNTSIYPFHVLNEFTHEVILILLHLFLRILFIYFRERGREGEKHWCERETLFSHLSHMHQLGTRLETQACALTRNWTNNLSHFAEWCPARWATAVRTNLFICVGAFPLSYKSVLIFAFKKALPQKNSYLIGLCWHHL